ncbi:MAG TPA: HEAT repeat domain-containing protein, partial [Luteolibacter sp.]|nr:HEAT repeat domain-containing protein [Luteolibacter sp.]
MKPPIPIARLAIAFALALVSSAAAGEAAAALQSFAEYQQGKPLTLLIDARREVFLGTADPAVQTQRERELLAFIASDAQPQAKAIAIEWLGCLGSAASVPELGKAAKEPALSAAVAAALERIKGAQRSGNPTISKDAAEVAAFNAALDEPARAAEVDERIATALRSPNELLAGSALRRLREGLGSANLSKALLGALDQVPMHRQIPLCEALAPRADAAATLHAILKSRVQSGDSDTRVAALGTLGRILRPDDLPQILALQSDTATPGLSAAAKGALSRATDPAIDPSLLQIAGTDAATRIAAIDALASRNVVGSVDRLWPLATAPDPQVAAAAYRALGTLLLPEALPDVLTKLAAAKDKPAMDALGDLLWNVVRRHPDPAAVATLLEQQAANMPAESKALVMRYADRIRPKSAKPKETQSKANRPAPSPLELPATEDRLKLSPDGYQQLAYLDCGSQNASSGTGIVIRRTAGEPYQFGNHAHPLATMDFGKTVSYEITGLDAKAEYVIGFSSWDADLQGRRQTLSINDTVLLGDFAPLAYHAGKPSYTRIHLPLPKALISDSKATLSMQSLAGPNAVISELWLLRREAEATAKKRVLILTGDDFEGHRWRETAPEFAAILRADPRLEVTISESPALLESPILSSYDAVFLHFKN